MGMKKGPKENLQVYIANYIVFDRVMTLLEGHSGSWIEFDENYQYLTWEVNNGFNQFRAVHKPYKLCSTIDEFLGYFNTNKIYELWL